MAFVSADKQVLISKVYVNRVDQTKVGGISPQLSAIQVRFEAFISNICFDLVFSIATIWIA